MNGQLRISASMIALLMGFQTGGARLGHAQPHAGQPEQILLWPAGHPANKDPADQVQEQRDDADPPWMSGTSRTKPSVMAYLPERPNGAAVVICPGGGYGSLSMEKEGVEVAQWMNQRGMAAFVLRYRCGGGKNQQPAPLNDAQRALRLVRSRADQWKLDPERVGILGFSAGGHLASSAATKFDSGDSSSDDPLDRPSSRPNFAVLVYPVISMREGVTHGGSRRNLLGEDADEALVEAWSTDEQVSDDTPPTFLIHASDDRAVPLRNAMLFYEALIQHGVPAEMHIYEQGGHGFGMLRGDRPADQWPTLLEPWLRGQGVLP